MGRSDKMHALKRKGELKKEADEIRKKLQDMLSETAKHIAAVEEMWQEVCDRKIKLCDYEKADEMQERRRAIASTDWILPQLASSGIHYEKVQKSGEKKPTLQMKIENTREYLGREKEYKKAGMHEIPRLCRVYSEHIAHCTQALKDIKSDMLIYAIYHNISQPAVDREYAK